VSALAAVWFAPDCNSPGIGIAIRSSYAVAADPDGVAGHRHSRTEPYWRNWCGIDARYSRRWCSRSRTRASALRACPDFWRRVSRGNCLGSRRVGTPFHTGCSPGSSRLFRTVGGDGRATRCLGILSERMINWFKFSSPKTFYPLAGKLIPWLAAMATMLAIAGMYVGFFVAPTDAQQGEGYRIIFLHVPVSWMSMLIYLAMAFWAAIGLVFNSRLSAMMASALAPK